MKKKIIALMFIMVLLIGCGKNNVTQTDTINDSAENIGNAEVDNEVEIDSDKEVITSFYDNINKAYEWSKAGSGRKNAEIIELTKSAMDALEEANNSDNKYSEYITNMVNNGYYRTFKVVFIDNEVGADFDSNLTKSMYAREMGEVLKRLVEVQLPFEYDNQSITEDSTQNSEYTYAEIRGFLADYVRDMSSSGVMIQDYLNYYAFPDGKYIEYEVDGKKIQSHYSVDFADLSTYGMSHGLYVYGYGKEPNSITYKAGNDEITFYSSDLLNADVYSYIMSFVGFYGSNNTEETNQQYYKIESLFNQNDTITVMIDDAIEFDLMPEDIENARAWFLFFDVLRGYVEQ